MENSASWRMGTRGIISAMESNSGQLPSPETSLFSTGFSASSFSHADYETIRRAAERLAASPDRQTLLLSILPLLVEALSKTAEPGRVMASVEHLINRSGDPIHTPVSYTHLRAHETRHDLVCRL